MGFLDKKDRVIDMVLTDEGKRQLSAGELELSFYAFFDDGVDYDPWVAESGSLDADALLARKRQLIEDTLSLEATPGLSYRRLQNDLETIETNYPLHTMPQNKDVLQRISYNPDTLSGSIRVVERRVQELRVVRDQSNNIVESSGPYDRGFEVLESGVFRLEADVLEGLPSSQGFKVSILRSGSDGLDVVEPKLDFDEVLSYGADLKLFIDEIPSADVVADVEDLADEVGRR
jgi:hypothetical protein